MRRISHLLLLPLCVLLLAATACQRIPLHERESGVYLKLTVERGLPPDQEKAVDFDKRPQLRDKVMGKMPEMVRACFYDAVSHNLVVEDFLPPTGGFVDVPAGMYDVIVYSLGTEASQLAGTDSRAGGYIFTSRTGVQVKLQGAGVKTGEEGDEASIDAQPVIFEPDHVFVGKIVGAEVPVRPADASETVVLTAEMQRVSESWSLEIIDIVGVERIQKAEIYVTGQAAGYYLWDGRTTNHPAALGFTGEIDTEKGYLFTVFNTFGKYPQPESDVLVNLLVTTTGGTRCRFLFDLTEQWLNPDNTAHRLVIDETLEIPDGDAAGGGLDPIVNEWDGDVVDIIIE